MAEENAEQDADWEEWLDTATDVAERTAREVASDFMSLDPEAVAHTMQSAYISNQLIKWDMELVSATPSGLTIAGTEVLKWDGLLTGTRFSADHRRRQRAEGDSETGAHSGQDLPGEVSELRNRVEQASESAERARRFTSRAVEKVDRTSRALGRQVGQLRGDLGTVRGLVDRARSRADSAHRRIDAVDRADSRSRRNVREIGSRQPVTSRDPRRLRDAAVQIQQIESRLNGLIAALG